MIDASMKTAASPSLSSLVRGQLNRPSPIRQIMKMAERQNILAMGLDPAQVISFGGGWVNHAAPEEFRQAYQSVVSDPDLFHKSGGYTATLGDMECREQIALFEAELFGMPRVGAQHVAIGMGSTQLTHDLFRTLLHQLMTARTRVHNLDLPELDEASERGQPCPREPSSLSSSQRTDKAVRAPETKRPR